MVDDNRIEQLFRSVVTLSFGMLCTWFYILDIHVQCLLSIIVLLYDRRFLFTCIIMLNG